MSPRDVIAGWFTDAEGYKKSYGDEAAIEILSALDAAGYEVNPKGTREALEAIPLYTRSAHGRGGWLVCGNFTGCYGRADKFEDMQHSSSCFVPLVTRALKEPGT